MHNKVCLPICILLAVLTAKAADVSGKWVGHGKSKEVTLDLKARGESLTGKVVQAGHSAVISNGKVDGDNVTFSVKRTPDAPASVYKGKIEGDTLKLDIHHTTADGKVETEKVTARRCPPDCSS